MHHWYGRFHVGDVDTNQVVFSEFPPEALPFIVKY
jgi:hypothetical protein